MTVTLFMLLISSHVIFTTIVVSTHAYGNWLGSVESQRKSCKLSCDHHESFLDFKDVLLRPKRSTLKSRADVDLRREMKFRNSGNTYEGVPVMASNMDTVGTFEMVKALAKSQLFTCVHKHYSVDAWKQFASEVGEDVLKHVAISSGILESDLAKLKAIANAVTAVRFLCIDVANGYTESFVACVRSLRREFPRHTIIAGNVATGEMVEELILSGADIVKVGIGPGSVCTTRKKAGVGYPQFSAVLECADAAHGLLGHIISDGGCTCPGDLAKAFGAGADFVMLGGMLAGHDECGGETVEKSGGKLFKQFYGMASATALLKHSGSLSDYRAAEGKTVEVPYRGEVDVTVQDILGGLRSACTYTGALKLKELPRRSTFVRVTQQTNEYLSYPKAPKDVQLKLSIAIDRHEKYIRANVVWEVDENDQQLTRKGFYLSFIAKEDACEKKFPGYYTQNIAPASRSWLVPLETLALQPLTLDYGCTYRIEMRSTPYPYGEPEYTTVSLFTVPDCIDEICDCRKQHRLPSPRNLKVEPFWDPTHLDHSVNISWKFKYPDYIKDNISFHLKLADLYRILKFANNRKLFKWRPFDFEVTAERERVDYSIVIPFLGNGTEYKISIFAMDQHYCKNDDLFQTFALSTLQENMEPVEALVLRSANLPTNSKFDDQKQRVPNDTNDNSSSLVELVESNGAVSSTTLRPIYVIVSEHTNNGDSFHQKPSDEYLVLFLPIIAVLCVVITVFLVCKIVSARRERLRKEQQFLDRNDSVVWTVMGSNTFMNPAMQTNILYTEKEVAEARDRGVADRYEVFIERLTFGRVIGQGAFGLVYVGTADSINGINGTITVAIKQLKANADEQERQEFLSEITILKQVGSHENIVNMLGCCTICYPYCMVMEYVPYGDLLQYLRGLRKDFETSETRAPLQNTSSNNNLNLIKAIPFNGSCTIPANSCILKELHSTDVASGSGTSSSCHCAMCERLPEIPFADAELPTIIGDGPICSISNSSFSIDPIELQSFALQVANGMEHLELLQVTHRDLAARNILVGHGKVLKISDFGLSRVGVYVKTTSGRIPLRWLSVEAMRDNVYTTKSDIWSYGVVLWEICTLGGFPYPSVTDKDLLKHLESGKRLERPMSCSAELYDVMLNCWAEKVADRPSFGDLKKRLTEMDNDGSPYVEFIPNSFVLPQEEYCQLASETCAETANFSSP